MKNKFLLFSIGFLSLFLTQTSIGQVHIISQGFDGATFPPTGWKDTAALTSPGFYKWWRSTGTSPVVINGTSYSATPTPLAGHNSSLGMAWFNSSALGTGKNSDLVTPPFSLTAPTGIAYYRLSFWVYNDYTNTGEQLVVVLNDTPNSTLPSPTGYAGATLATISPNSTNSITPVWKHYLINLPTTPAYMYTVPLFVAFKGMSTVASGGNDIYIDDVEIDSVPPCNGLPHVGTVSTVAKACYGVPFTLGLTDTSVAAGIKYKWQYSSPDSLHFVDYPNDTLAITSASITTPTYFRAIAKCVATNDSSVTPAKLVGLNPFYLCYCSVAATGVPQTNVANVSLYTAKATGAAGSLIFSNSSKGGPIPPLNNTNARMRYTDYTSVAPATLHLDSLYKNTVYAYTSQGSFPSPDSVRIYIDYNHDSAFTPDELLNRGRATSAVPFSDTFRIPHNAVTGLTGMRVFNYTSTFSPTSGTCLPASNGEVEDYLVNIALDNCAGYPNPGLSTAADSSLCPGTALKPGSVTTLSNTTHETNEIGLSWYWQQSIDSGRRWASALSLPAYLNKDVVIVNYVGPTWYRLAIGCALSNDTSFSNPVVLVNNPPYACNCPSYANGINNDTTDIGAFGFGQYLFQRQDSVNNPHVNNTLAYRPHTDYTSQYMNLVAGRKYHVFAYQIMKRYHGDAKFTLFIDYNNNHKYEPTGYLSSPPELVWTAYTRVDTFFVSTDITIPKSVVPNTFLTMRLILNSDTNPNGASDTACGVYTSGETQDFTLIIHDSAHVNVGTINNVENIVMYPNPSTGRFNVNFFTPTLVKDAYIRVSNITGQQLLMRKYQNINGQFNAELDLSNQPRGLYYIELVADGQRTVRLETIN